MEISLRYVATKTIEVRTVRDLAEAVGANLFGCVAVDWLPAPKNHVVYFADTDYDSDSRIKFEYNLAWTPSVFVDFNQEIESVDDVVVSTAKALFENRNHLFVPDSFLNLPPRVVGGGFNSRIDERLILDIVRRDYEKWGGPLI